MARRRCVLKENYSSLDAKITVLEDKREIKNLMGRFTASMLYCDEEYILDRYWSRRKDVSYGTNQGWYIGPESIASYHDALTQKRKTADKILRTRFPALTGCFSQTDKGYGTMNAQTLSSDIIVVGDDRKTAKGIWTCAGQLVDMTECGPITIYTYGVYACDFVREEDEWKLWHMCCWDDIHRPMGEKWWEPEKSYPPLEEWKPMTAVLMPEPVQPVHRPLYSTTRSSMPFPQPPQRYRTFCETFSYGPEGGETL